MSHPNLKLRGYMYEIVEFYPHEDGYSLVRHLHSYDNLEDANKVMEALESVNYNWTCYGMIMRPVWEERHPKPVQFQLDIGWDANGSPTF